MPSLGTATKLARGLRELRDDAEPSQYLGMVTAVKANPIARVEYALRADELLSEPDVRQVMELYLSLRLRRFGRRGSNEGGSGASDRPTQIRPSVWNSGSSAGPRVGLVARGSPLVRPGARSAGGRPPGRY
jgi:hypothetical protein